MASPGMEHLRSPFQNVFQILPQGHDKALKQAFYNTAATLFVVAVCGAGVAVYYILEAFLRPLLWAVLCGTFLHPFKNTLTWLVQGWLKKLRTTKTPLLVGTILIPFEVVDHASEVLHGFLFGQMKAIIGVCLGLPTVYLLYYFGPLKKMFFLMQMILSFVYEALGYFNALWVWTVVMAYVLVVIFYWTPESSPLLRKLAIPVWTVLLFYIATVAGELRVPMVIGVVVLLIVGFISELNEARKQNVEEGSEKQMSPSDAAFNTVWKMFYNLTDNSTDHSSDAETLTSGAPVEGETSSAETPNKEATAPNEPPQDTNKSPESDENTDKPAEKTRPSKLPTDEKQKGKEPKEKPAKPKSLSDHCFIGLIYALVLAKMWRNLWILQLLPLALLVLFIKKIGRQLVTSQMLQDKAKAIHDLITRDSRIDILAPKPIRGLIKILLRGDGKIVRALEQSMDKAMSILIIIILLVGMVLMTFFMAVQVHRESVHLVSVSSNVLNNSMHPELNQWLPNNEDMQEALDSMVGNAYLYGREWIASKLHQTMLGASSQNVVAAETKVLGLWDQLFEAYTSRIHSAFNGDQDNEAKMQEQVLQVWDRMYETWFHRNTSNSEVLSLSQPEAGSAMSNLTSMWEMVQKTDYNSLNIVEFIKEHIGIVMSVAESVWLVLKGNLNLALSVLTAMLSMLLGGGTAILNFVLSAVVFLTTLFYLLASSGDTYKPMELIMSLTPAGTGGTGSRFGQAVEEAIGSVFRASLKMAVFYGLYTWFTHTLFCINIVFIPSVMAAVFAAIPFVGTYFAALPAIIELWLVNGEPTQALMLLIIQMLPTFFVDTAIYSGIQGGHPYLTGLAIAGGMYWMGLEGAIMGPIILCCLIVAVNVYSTMLQPEAGLSSTPTVRKPGARKKQVTFQRAFSEDLGSM